ncbi:MAG: N-acetylneuraminate lyase [Spirochaetes bacterium]|nr:N-acetylneuraminate lyase [Spirochaetota bacterium]MBU1080210.1 N-acetylneuraminate lyase [Spirochaetota bacterium]
MSALLVPFDRDGSILEKGLAETVEFNIGQGIEGLYVNGSTGENLMLSTLEKKRVLTLAAEVAAKRIPLIAQVGSLDVREARELAAHALDQGYDAISSVTPFYYQFSYDEIVSYYRTLGEGCPLPLIVYFIPALTGKQLSKQQLAGLLELPTVAGIKFTSDNMYQLERLRRLFPDKIIYNGYDELCASGLIAGADGAIGSTFNITAPVVLRIRDAIAAGDLRAAQALQHALNDFIEQAVDNGLYQTLKYMLSLQGVQGGHCRAPFLPLGEERQSRARDILSGFKNALD